MIQQEERASELDINATQILVLNRKQDIGLAECGKRVNLLQI
jgi:hypothetical protein